uniref:Uncharacterized protein n=1 Tax=Aegilops tauschii subsp. strangulata TaxID=200361 RepID=A0A453LD01_AEGTS
MVFQKRCCYEDLYRILVAANESCNDGAELTRGKRPNCGVSPLLELLVPGQDLYLDSPFAAPLHRPDGDG